MNVKINNYKTFERLACKFLSVIFSTLSKLVSQHMKTISD